jgi:hypothetical protein
MKTWGQRGKGSGIRWGALAVVLVLMWVCGISADLRIVSPESLGEESAGESRWHVRSPSFQRKDPLSEVWLAGIGGAWARWVETGESFFGSGIELPDWHSGPSFDEENQCWSIFWANEAPPSAQIPLAVCLAWRHAGGSSEVPSLALFGEIVMGDAFIHERWRVNGTFRVVNQVGEWEIQIADEEGKMCQHLQDRVVIHRLGALGRRSAQEGWPIP